MEMAPAPRAALSFLGASIYPSPSDAPSRAHRRQESGSLRAATGLGVGSVWEGEARNRPELYGDLYMGLPVGKDSLRYTPGMEEAGASAVPDVATLPFHGEPIYVSPSGGPSYTQPPR